MTDSLRPSVVVCADTMERFDRTRRCIASVLAGERERAEIFLVVDENLALRDRFLSVLPTSARALDNEGSGAADARMTALCLATSEIVTFIDDDASADQTWLVGRVDAFADPQVRRAGGRVEREHQDDHVTLALEIDWIVESTYRGHRIDAGPISRPIGANMAVRRAVFLELGGFPSSFGPRAGFTVSSNEELAAFTPMTNRDGHDCVQYAPGAIVHHFAPTKRCTLSDVARRSFVEGESKADGRKIFGPSSMEADRTYVREAIALGVRGCLAESVRASHLRSMPNAVLAATYFSVAACWYVTKLALNRAKATRQTTADVPYSKAEELKP